MTLSLSVALSTVILLIIGRTIVALDTPDDSVLLVPKVNIPTLTLSNGVEVPQFAAGTLFRKGAMSLPEQAHRALTHSIEAGVRHIDTALLYRSQKQINSVLSRYFASGRLRREDVFLTTKVYHGPLGVPSFNDYDSTLPIDEMSPDEITDQLSRHVERCLDELGVGYVDMLLLHWPAQWTTDRDDDEGYCRNNRARRLAAWRVLEATLERGWARAIGVSNFSEHHLRQLEEDGAKVTPMVNQIEASVYVQYEGIMEYCRNKGIVVQAFSPLGAPVPGSSTHTLLKDPVLMELADKYQKNPGQVALRFLIQKGLVVIAMSTSESRIRGNLDIFEFTLEETDMEKLETLKGKTSMLDLPSPYDLS